MAKLTADEIAFLTSQGIGVEQMFDAAGMSVADRKLAMKAAGKYFYVGGARCAAAGHQIRTRQGHCVQCNTSLIAYALRHSSSAQVYVAGSLKGRCVKIGSTEDIGQRLVRLRSHSYGAFDDWEMLAATQIIDNAGRFEFEAQKKLSRFQSKSIYVKSGAKQEARELFVCTFPVAANALIAVLPEPNMLAPLCTLQRAKMYEWKSVLEPAE